MSNPVAVIKMWSARCKAKIPVVFSEGQWLVESGCPDGHTGQVGEIIASKCGTCSKAVVEVKTTPVIPDLPPPPRVEAPAKEVAPVPVQTVPVQAPLVQPQAVQIAEKPVAPPMPAPAPAASVAPQPPVQVPVPIPVTEPVVESVAQPAQNLPPVILPPWVAGPAPSQPAPGLPPQVAPVVSPSVPAPAPMPTPILAQTVVHAVESVVVIEEPQVVTQELPPDFEILLEPIAVSQATTVTVQSEPVPVQMPEQGFTPDPAILPYDFSKTEDEVPSVDSIMAEVPGYLGGPSSGGISSHQMANAKCWRHFYWSHVRGLRAVRKKGRSGYVHHNDLGTVFHACMAMRYSYGQDATYLPCDAVEAHGMKELGRRVRMLVVGMLEKFARTEYETWTVRAVEQNLIAHLPKVKIQGKWIQIPISTRLDLMIGEKALTDNPAPGYYPPGVYLLDHKTTRYMTLDAVLSFGMSWQFLVYMAAYVLGEHDKTYGPLNGFIANLAEHGRTPPDDKSFYREKIPYNPSVIQGFVSSELIPVATSITEKLMDPKAKETDVWPMDRRMCEGKYGRCPYFRLCDRQSIQTTGWYVEEPSMIIDPFAFALPPKAKKIEEASPSSEVTPEIKSEVLTSEEVIIAVAAGMEAALNSDPGYDWLRQKREIYLGPGTPKNNVVKRFTEDLKLVYGQWARDKVEHKMVIKGLEVGMRYTTTGFSWDYQGLKGRISWTKIATALAENHWFNPSQIPDPIPGTNQ